MGQHGKNACIIDQNRENAAPDTLYDPTAAVPIS
jgi:hypothetical protein